MPAFVKTKDDEGKWDKAKDAAGKEGDETKWPLANHIFQKMKHPAAKAAEDMKAKMRDGMPMDKKCAK
jgi:hypothetical protein